MSERRIAVVRGEKDGWLLPSVPVKLGGGVVKGRGGRNWGEGGNLAG